VLRTGVHHNRRPRENGYSGSENGPPKADKLFDHQNTNRPDGPRAGQARPLEAQPKAACVSEIKQTNTQKQTPPEISGGVFIQT